MIPWHPMMTTPDESLARALALSAIAKATGGGAE